MSCGTRAGMVAAAATRALVGGPISGPLLMEEPVHHGGMVVTSSLISTSWRGGASFSRQGPAGGDVQRRLDLLVAVVHLARRGHLAAVETVRIDPDESPALAGEGGDVVLGVGLARQGTPEARTLLAGD